MQGKGAHRCCRYKGENERTFSCLRWHLPRHVGLPLTLHVLLSSDVKNATCKPFFFWTFGAMSHMLGDSV